MADDKYDAVAAGFAPCTSTTTTTKKTKKTTLTLPRSEKCWHCGASPIHVCPVLANAHIVLNYFNKGLVNIKSAHHEDNAVLLCPTCHANFDDSNDPGLMFFPTYLDFFFEAERADFERRKELITDDHSTPPTVSVPIRRTSPTKAEYQEHCLRELTTIRAPAPTPSSSFPDFAVPSANNTTWSGDGAAHEASRRRLVRRVRKIGGLYSSFVLRPFLPSIFGLFVGHVAPDSPWHGDPMVCLQRAISGLEQVTREPSSQVFCDRLQDLARLYDENDRHIHGLLHPQLRDQLSTPLQENGDDDDGETPAKRKRADAVEIEIETESESSRRPVESGSVPRCKRR